MMNAILFCMETKVTLADHDLLLTRIQSSSLQIYYNKYLHLRLMHINDHLRSRIERTN